MSPHLEFLRWARRWLLPAALLALVPKCVLCVAGYCGLGVLLGLPLAGREFCGDAPNASHSWMLTTPLVVAGMAASTWWWRRHLSARRECLCLERPHAHARASCPRIISSSSRSR